MCAVHLLVGAAKFITEHQLNDFSASLYQL
jgi:hypothetical protein